MVECDFFGKFSNTVAEIENLLKENITKADID